MAYYIIFFIAHSYAKPNAGLKSYAMADVQENQIMLGDNYIHCRPPKILMPGAE